VQSGIIQKTIYMSSYSRDEVVLIRYPFSDLSGSKVRPAVIASAPHPSVDVLIVPLTSKITPLLVGEFVLKDWSQSGLNVPSAVKRGIYTLQESLIVKRVGQISSDDSIRLDSALRMWLKL
jgi:mRNA interferase MazF